MVLQETVLFSGTVRERISLARPDATAVEIEAAAAMAAQIHHVVRSWLDDTRRRSANAARVS